MSIRVMTNVWQHSKCKGADLLLLLAIADNANDDGYAWPGIESLATKTRMSQRSIQYNTKRLAAAGELVIMPQAGPKGTNKYRVIPVDDPAWGRKVCVGAENAGAQVDATEGASTRKEGVQAFAPEPSLEPSIEPSVSKTTRVKLEDFQPSAEQTQWAIELGVPFRSLDSETEQFKDYHRERGTKIVDAAAAWRRWMRNSVKWSKPANGSTYKPKEAKRSAEETNNEAWAEMAAERGLKPNRTEREGRIQVDDAYEARYHYAE